MQEPPVRQKILEAVRARPGTYRLQLCQQLGIPWGTLCYHVRVLRAQSLVDERSHKGRSILTPHGFSPEQARFAASLRARGAREVFFNLNVSQGVGIQEISERLHLSRKVVRRILEEFVDNGALQRQPGLRGKFHIADPAFVSLAMQMADVEVGLGGAHSDLPKIS